ncbi:ATP-binding cassette domain-containing protein, partial [Enterococcus faecalis]|nr:ATP-binding cassette domain-containing protein [Enterococcus faecalis]
MLTSGIMQTDERDCASACLATLCLEFDIKVSKSVLHDLIKIDQIGGTLYGLIEASKKLGLIPTPLKGTYDEFLCAFKNGQVSVPCIASTITDNNMSHFVVINQISENKVTIFDPAKGDLTISHDRFLMLWGGSVLVVDKPATIEKSTYKPYGKYLDIINKNKTHLFVLSLFSIIISSMTILVSLSYQYVIDFYTGASIKPTNGFGNTIYPLVQNFWIMFLGLSSIYLLQSVINYFRARSLASFTKKVSMDLFNSFSKALLESKYAFLESKQIGDIISRSQTVIELQQNFSSVFLTFVLEIFSLIVSGFILFFLNSELFKIVLIMGILLLVLSVFFISPIDKLSKLRIEQGGELVTSISALVSNGINSRIYRQGNFFESRFYTKVDKLIQTLYREILIKNISFSISAAIQNIFLLLVILRGGFLVSKGIISIGQLVSFQMIMPFFILPVKNLLSIQTDVQKIIVGMNKLNDILDCPFPDQKNKKYSLETLVTLEDVSYSHNYQNIGIDKINLKLYSNEKICFFGENGSGKSTLLKMLINVYNPDSGKVILGKEIFDNKIKISFVEQNPNFFPGTLSENISFGTDNFNHDKYVKSCYECGLSNFEKQFSQGLHTRIIENGSNLSGGQRQQLS